LKLARIIVVACAFSITTGIIWLTVHNHLYRSGYFWLILMAILTWYAFVFVTFTLLKGMKRETLGAIIGGEFATGLLLAFVFGQIILHVGGVFLLVSAIVPILFGIAILFSQRSPKRRRSSSQRTNIRSP